MAFLKTRMNRATYWLCFGAFVAVAIALSLAMDDPPKGGSGMMLILFALRLHDIGRTGWWALAPLAIQLGLILGFMAFNLMGLGILLAMAFTFVVLVVLGSIPGQPEANRFGEPPLPGLKSAFKPARS